MKVNLGCGETKLEGFINIDIEASVKPDIICDFRKNPLPFKDGDIEAVYSIHNIEHIEFVYWPLYLSEIYRVLQKDGVLVLAYPEFEVCVQNFLENKRGKKNFWRMTLYGRQLYPGDYHVTPVITGDLINYLRAIGFTNFRHGPEGSEDYYTMLSCLKGRSITREDIIKKEVFGHEIPV